MINKLGISGLIKNISPNIPIPNESNPTYLAGRVIDIILNENHPDFSSQGGWNSLGSIKFKISTPDNSGNIKWAKPLHSNIKCYPLVNERIIILLVPVPQLSSESYIYEYYYINNIAYWNHPHHNAYPEFDNPLTIDSQIQDYQQTDGGTVRRIQDDSTEISLNSPTNPSQDSFIEKSSIHPLISFPGDILYEGRWGNSLRFGSTSKTITQVNNIWSEDGNDGDPITILRNGQPSNVSDEGWIPIVEDITQDLSSIYLTSTQKIPFSIANENFISYTTPPVTPAQFSNPQIILNSDRIILNAKSDSILISGQNSVGLSSNGSINLESTSEINITSKLTRLGNTSANQSVLRGDETVEYLKILINELQNITEALKVVQDWPSGTPSPNPVILTTANSALKVFENVYNQIDSVKSKIVKTA